MALSAEDLPLVDLDFDEGTGAGAGAGFVGTGFLAG